MGRSTALCLSHNSRLLFPTTPYVSFREDESARSAYTNIVVQWFNGDGNISAFRIKDGYIDLKQRYVRTEKFVREAEARRALIGEACL